MVDQEVEATLREIRERVRAEAASRAPAQTTPATIEPGAAPVAAARGTAADAIARMHANAATTERAWSRLPPLMSYRSGAAARFELWLKRLVKRAAHWFTWEQVNFNSAVHHSLADAREALAAHEQVIERLRAEVASLHQSLEGQMRAELEAERAKSEAHHAESEARHAELGARMARAESRAESELARLGGLIADTAAQLRSEQAASAESLSAGQREILEALRGELESYAAALRREAREQVSDVLEEQRVCFRQLSLESTEAAVAQDRARRLTESRLEALEAKMSGG